MRGLPSILSLFRNKFDKFRKTRVRMLESIYHMTSNIVFLTWKHRYFDIVYAIYNGRHYDKFRNL